MVRDESNPDGNVLIRSADLFHHNIITLHENIKEKINNFLPIFMKIAENYSPLLIPSQRRSRRLKNRRSTRKTHSVHPIHDA